MAISSSVGPHPGSGSVLKVRSFLVIGAAAGASTPRIAGDAFEWRTPSLLVRAEPRRGADRDRATTERPPVLLLGDDAEWDAARPERNLANAVPITIDPAADRITLHTSIVGLPAVFVHRSRHGVVLSSDVHLLRDVPWIRLELDARGVLELGRIGHPVDHRTLFADVTLATSGARLELGPDGALAVSRSWRMPARTPVARETFLEAQIDAFTNSVRRTDLSETFLSLTAGLDTRTVFAVLAQQDRLVPAATMSGPRVSLDAAIARRLCRAYGTEHQMVVFDDTFTRDLPRFLEIASRLSGGLSTLGQAPEVFLYDRVGAGFSARLSGNLGNQVGRGGTEGVSVRGADLRILGDRFAEDAAGSGNEAGADHWLLSKLDQDENARIEFILQCETVFTSVGNFGIGHHFAAQQTPYADRTLIETLALRPQAGSPEPSGSMIAMRMRDLRHRFLGEPESASFQRTLVRRIDGFAAECPVNWGWRPSGGVSPSGLLLGVATLGGMAIRARGLDAGFLRRPIAWSGLPALHDFREARRWLREDLRTYLADLLGSRRVRESGLFNEGALRIVLDQHASGQQDHYETVTFALDLALANQLFCESAP